MRNEIRKFILSWLRPDVLAKEQRRLEMASAVQKHWKDNGPIHLYELIREEWDDREEEGVDEDSFYVVFIDEDIAIDWITEKKLSPEQSDAISHAESIGAKECKYLPKERQLEFRRLLGQAIVCAIDGNLEDSRRTADSALLSLMERTIERSRQWTLQWTHIFLCIAISTFCRYQSCPADFLSWAIFGGIVGAFLSIVQKAGKGKWNAAAGQWVHVVEVFSKIVSGGVLGGIAFAVVRSPLCPKLLETDPETVYMFFLVGVMAGLFERLIPRILSSYGDSVRKDKNEAKSDSD